MPTLIKQVLQVSIVVITSVTVMSCVTETRESATMNFSETAVVSVGDPNVSVMRGSTFAWSPDAVRFYQDERLQYAG